MEMASSDPPAVVVQEPAVVVQEPVVVAQEPVVVAQEPVVVAQEQAPPTAVAASVEETIAETVAVPIASTEETVGQTETVPLEIPFANVVPVECPAQLTGAVSTCEACGSSGFDCGAICGEPYDQCSCGALQDMCPQ